MTSFDDPDLLRLLDERDPPFFDDLPFGVITFTRDGTVIAYNANESQRSGLTPARVVGRHIFTQVAPCTNNYLISERYAEQDELDEQLDYVFTFVMRPTPVRLRLLGSMGASRRYLVVRSRAAGEPEEPP